MGNDKTTCNSTTLVVGLSGPKHVGKSTLANALTIIVPDCVAQMHAVDMVYAGVSEILQVSRNYLESPETKDIPWDSNNAPAPSLIGFTPRDIIDNICLNWRQTYGNNIFVELWRRRAQNLGHKIVINPSCRFEHDLAGIDLVVELNRSGVDYDGTLNNTRLVQNQVPSINVDLDLISPLAVYQELLKYCQ